MTSVLNMKIMPAFVICFKTESGNTLTQSTHRGQFLLAYTPSTF